MSALRTEVARRERTAGNYDREPFYAAVYDGDRLVSMQYGAQPGIAFQKAWRYAQEYREREPITGVVTA